MDEYALEITNVTKTFLRDDKDAKERRGLGRLSRALTRRRVSTTVVDDVSMSVPRGAIYGVVGPNGSGKSTLVRMVSTLLLPDAGTIAVFGHDVVQEPLAVQRLINRVSVDAAFFKKLSALENLVYTGRLYGLRPAVAVERTRSILEKLGFDKKRIDSSMEELSRGMQQKVCLLYTSPSPRDRS